jgi:maltooligosyltrehalose synthase
LQLFVGTSNFPFYIAVEKILVCDERLRRQWPVHRTTGYDFLDLLDGIFVDLAGDPSFWDLYARFISTALYLVLQRDFVTSHPGTPGCTYDGGSDSF